jgi:predicted RND superfamily exporter protein
MFSSSDLIRTFGEAGLTATIIALLGVLMLVPLLGVILIRNEEQFAAKVRTSDFGVNALRRFCAWIAARMVNRPGTYSLIALAFVVALAVIYATLEPRYRLADQVPDREQAVAANSRLDVKLTGANPIDVLIEFPSGKSLYDADTLNTIGEVHSILEKQAGVGNVWSLETLRRWLKERVGTTDVGVLRQYVDVIPEHLTRRFISAEQDAVVVSGRIPDVDASQLLPVIEELDKELGKVRDAHPGYMIAVTGLSAIAARNSADMIGKLNSALTIEIVFVAAFIGMAFRSFIVMLLSVLPGIFPIVLSGTVLWLMGEGLNFAAVVALIVSFGLGLSATIHFLNRMRLEDRPEADPALAVERATVLVGPALILTSVVLACGLAVTVLSDLPSLRTFGWLSAFAMIAALIADLLILRPTAVYLFRLGKQFRRRRLTEQAAE